MLTNCRTVARCIRPNVATIAKHISNKQPPLVDTSNSSTLHQHGQALFMSHRYFCSSGISNFGDDNGEKKETESNVADNNEEEGILDEDIEENHSEKDEDEDLEGEDTMEYVEFNEEEYFDEEPHPDLLDPELEKKEDIIADPDPLMEGIKENMWNIRHLDDPDEEDAELLEKLLADPIRWSTDNLAKSTLIPKPNLEARIFLKALEYGISKAELAERIREGKERAKIAHAQRAFNLANARERKDDIETRRLESIQQGVDNDLNFERFESFPEEEQRYIMGGEYEPFRSPDYYFLNDEFEGLPPLSKRMGKFVKTDKLHPIEAIELQRLAEGKKVTMKKSFARIFPPKESNVQDEDDENESEENISQTKKRSGKKWKISVRDISTYKAPLYIRSSEDRSSLRLATKEEVLPRTWVRRPPFFDGLDNLEQ